MNTYKCIRIEADIEQIHRCKEMLATTGQSIGDLSDVLRLAGNEVRLKILYLLHVETRLCVCDISDVLNMNIAAISQHLRKMKDGGLVISNKEGQTIFYSLTKDYRRTLVPLFKQIENMTEAVLS